MKNTFALFFSRRKYFAEVLLSLFFLKKLLANFPTSSYLYFYLSANGINRFKNKISKIQMNDAEILSSVQVHNG